MHSHGSFIKLAIKIERMLEAQRQVLELQIRTPKSYANMYGLQKGVDKAVLLLLENEAKVVWHEKFLLLVIEFRKMQTIEFKKYVGTISDKAKVETNGMKNYLLNMRVAFGDLYGLYDSDTNLETQTTLL